MFRAAWTSRSMDQGVSAAIQAGQEHVSELPTFRWRCPHRPHVMLVYASDPRRILAPGEKVAVCTNLGPNCPKASIHNRLGVTCTMDTAVHRCQVVLDNALWMMIESPQTKVL
jgi:hypothetical protein